MNRSDCAGFSLLELIISVIVVLVISGATLTVASYYQQSYNQTEMQSDMYENMRGVAELMEQEIGQAGLVSLPAGTLSAAVSANAAAQAVGVSSTTSMYVGEQLLIDTSTNEESVTITALNTTSNQITGIFSKAHASGAAINALGMFPNGIVPPGATHGSTSNAEPGVSTLNLFGDVNADGSLVYVRYTCDTSSTPGTLTRSITTIVPRVNTVGSAQTLLSTLVPNPGGTACFQYMTSTVSGYTFVTNVGVTLSVRTTKTDPRTKQYVTMTKSFLDLSPRNILAGYELASGGTTNRLQASPANVSAY